jgi:hypothetical protein
LVAIDLIHASSIVLLQYYNQTPIFVFFLLSSPTNPFLDLAMANEGISTRRRRINYYLLNDGSDEEGMDLDRTSDPSEVPAAIADNIPLPSEPDTQITETSPTAAVPAPCGFRRERPAPATEWIWSYFEVTTVDREWTVKRTGKRKLFGRDIRCVYVDEYTNVSQYEKPPRKTWN